MKNIKKIYKIFILVIALISNLLLISCNENGITKEEYFDIIKFKIADETSSDLNFPSDIDGIEIIYDSMNQDVLSNDGKVFPQEDDVEVKLLITIILNETEYIDYKYVTVKGKTSDVFDNTIYINTITNIFNEYDILNYSNENYEKLENLFQTAKNLILNCTNKEDAEKVINDYIIKFDEIEIIDKNITDEEKLDHIADELSNIINLSGKTIYTNLDLVKNSLYDSSIIWISDNESVLSNEGVIGDIQEKTKVKLSYTVVLNGKEYEGTFIEIFVDKSTLPSYYNSINLSESGSTLKQSLRTLITSTHKNILSYGDLRTKTAKTDVDPNNSNNLILFYSRVSVPSKWDSGNTWNREHVWPQSTSWFTTSGAGADIHHLRPTNPSTNSSRGNTPYGVVSHTENNRKKISISGHGIVDYGYANKTYFEPLDEVKGDVARIVFYLLVRYKESDSYSITKVAQSIDILLEWNDLDPVDSLERTRNEEAFKIQGNRNPFIDYSDFADMIF